MNSVRTKTSLEFQALFNQAAEFLAANKGTPSAEDLKSARQHLRAAAHLAYFATDIDNDMKQHYLFEAAKNLVQADARQTAYVCLRMLNELPGCKLTEESIKRLLRRDPQGLAAH